MTAKQKPMRSIGELMNISFGFFGIQIGFALQNSNMSRIFQSLGESIDNLPILWIAAPLTGLLVQPIIGHFSDKTWSKFGRRRPFFFLGAVLAALSLFYMPNVPGLIYAAFTLWILDASLNISMEPFRAFVGDMTNKDQHAEGYAIQTAFIGVGAVVGSVFPWFLDQIGVSNLASGGGIPDTVRFSFWFGGAALFIAVMWTILTTKEYSPQELAEFGEGAQDAKPAEISPHAIRNSTVWILAGAAVCIAVYRYALKPEVYVLGGLLIFYGLSTILAKTLANMGKGNNFLSSIVGDFSAMPKLMKKLALAQFFTWSSLFIMWIYTTPVVAQYVYGTTDASSAQFNEAGNWVGILFSVYNGVAAIAALFLLPLLSRVYGKARTHAIALLCGAAGYLCFFFIHDKNLLIFAEIGVGIAWASILAMPYAILASTLPQSKLGVYMGIFNIFIVVPQLLVATVMGQILKSFFPTEPIWTMVYACGGFGLAALVMLGIAREGAK